MLCFIGGRKDQWSVESHNEYYIYVIHYYYMPEGFKLQLQLHYNPWYCGKLLTKVALIAILKQLRRPHKP